MASRQASATTGTINIFCAIFIGTHIVKRGENHPGAGGAAAGYR
jgi:hypothetical protein